MTQPLIRFDKVSIIFGNKPQAALPLMDEGLERTEIQQRTNQILGVHDCSLDVHEGEIAVLMGLSGSGKSTLLRAVNGLNTVARGKMLVSTGSDMVDVAQADAKTLRQLRTERVSMVFQQFGLLPWRSVRDNVAFGLELAGVPEQERNDRASSQLAIVNLSDWADKQVSELSGGMQQRVGLARAFATEAPILLMDEPFSALDPLIRNHLQDELLELQQKLKRTIVFVSHDLEEAVKIGSTIAIMEGGRIVQAGHPEDIVLKPETPYVREFVSHLNPLSVLCACHIAQPLNGATPAPDSRFVDPDTPVKTLLPLFAESSGTIFTGVPGSPEGQIDPPEVFRMLSGDAN